MRKNPSKRYYADTKSFFSLVANTTLKLKFLIVQCRRKEEKKRFLAGHFFFFLHQLLTDLLCTRLYVVAHTATPVLPVLEFIITNYCTEALRRVWCADQKEVGKLPLCSQSLFGYIKTQVKYLGESTGYVRTHLWSQTLKMVTLSQLSLPFAYFSIGPAFHKRLHNFFPVAVLETLARRKATSRMWKDWNYK